MPAMWASLETLALSCITLRSYGVFTWRALEENVGRVAERQPEEPLARLVRELVFGGELAVQPSAADPAPSGALSAAATRRLEIGELLRTGGTP